MSRGRGRWVGAYHQKATSWQPIEAVPHQVSEPTLDLVSYGSATDGATHHEPDNRLGVRFGDVEVRDQGGATGTVAAFDRGRELVSPPHAGCF